MNQQTRDDLDDLAMHLEAFLALTAALGEAPAGDEHAQREIVRRIRTARARIYGTRAFLVAGLEPTDEDAAMASRLAALVHRATTEGMGALEAWYSARPMMEPVSSDAELDDALVDRTLPSDWDVESDIMVLAGPMVAPYARALRRLGQQRIAIYAPTGLPGNCPANVIHLRSTTLEGLKALIDCFQPPYPRKLVAKCLDPEGARGAEFKQLAMGSAKMIAAALGDEAIPSRFGELWARQALASVKEIASSPSIAALKGKFAGKVGIVVSPGPSLSTNADALLSLKGKALIIAMSQSVKILDAHGVVPDLVLVTDPQDILYHVDGYDTLKPEAWILSLTVHPGFYRLPMRRRFVYACNGHSDRWLETELLQEKMGLDSGGSVAHNAFALAHDLGCKVIALVGQDLAFAPDTGRVYAEGSPDATSALEMSPDKSRVSWGALSPGMRKLGETSGTIDNPPFEVHWVPGYYGGTVPTTFTYFRFREWFIAAAKDLPDVKLLNCTQGGCDIPGFLPMPLSSLEGWCQEFEVSPVLDEAIAKFDRPRRRDLIALRIVDIRSAARRCAVAAAKGVTAMSLVELDAAEAEVMREIKACESLLSLIVHREIAVAFSKQLLVPTEDGAASEAALLRAGRRLFGAIETGCRTIVELSSSEDTATLIAEVA